MDAETRPGAENRTIVAVFETLEDAERALDALRRTGLRREDVSLVMREAPAPSAEAADTMGGNVVTGAATGATVGGVLGGLAGWLLAALVPGVGPVLGAGVLASTLTGAAVGAAGGGILGALLGLGVPEDEAADYVDHVTAGRILVTVHAADPARHGRALEALAGSNARDVRTYTAPDAVEESRARAGETAPARAPAAGSPAAPDRPAPVFAGLGAGRAVGMEDEGNPGRGVGDVAAVESGGPDVRGELGQATTANRDLSDELVDVSEWRSGGELSRPADTAAPDRERGLDTAEVGALPPPPSGDVAAVTLGGPDVRPPGVEAVDADRDLGAPGVPLPADSWSDDPSAWRSGGEGARADTGEGVDALAPGVSSPDAGAARDLEVAPPPREAAALPPALLSRSALAFAVPGGLESADRDLAPAPEDANPEGYGDAGPD
jgi:uncharacterized membrane protein